MLRNFSWHDSIEDSVIIPKESNSLSGLSLNVVRICLYYDHALRATLPSVTSSNSMRPSITLYNRYWNINQFAIAYPFRTVLRTRLTLH